MRFHGSNWHYKSCKARGRHPIRHRIISSSSDQFTKTAESQRAGRDGLIGRLRSHLPSHNHSFLLKKAINRKAKSKTKNSNDDSINPSPNRASIARLWGRCLGDNIQSCCQTLSRAQNMWIRKSPTSFVGATTSLTLPSLSLDLSQFILLHQFRQKSPFSFRVVRCGSRFLKRCNLNANLRDPNRRHKGYFHKKSQIDISVQYWFQINFLVMKNSRTSILCHVIQKNLKLGAHATNLPNS